MHERDPAEAVEVLNLLLKFFGDGGRWIKGRFSDRRDNCCLVGAIDFVSSHHAIKGNAAERYLAAAISDERASAFVAMRMARTMPGCGRPFVARCGANGIGPAKLF
jgi:hypothetical protein